MEKREIDEAEWWPVLVLYEIEEGSRAPDDVFEFTPEFLTEYEKNKDAFEWFQSCIRAAWNSIDPPKEEEEEK